MLGIGRKPSGQVTFPASIKNGLTLTACMNTYCASFPHKMTKHDNMNLVQYQTYVYSMWFSCVTSPTPQITITDNDLIEKSNLNRQFLFRPQHIQVYVT